MSVELKVPKVGESISEVEIGEWLKKEGDGVQRDETVVTLESEKATVELPAPAAGSVTRILKKTGETAAVGEVIGYLEEGAVAAASPDKPFPAEPKPEWEHKTPGNNGVAQAEIKTEQAEKQTLPTQETPPRVMPAAQRELAQNNLSAEQVEASGPGGRVLKEDVQRAAAQKQATPAPVATPVVASEPPPIPTVVAQPSMQSVPSFEEDEEAVPMTFLRRKIAERLVEAQHNAALLTTFNEIDMSALMAMRKEHQDAFVKKYNTKLGFMSFFVKASIDALKLVPQVNAEIRGKDIVYHKSYDIGVAIGSGKGLVVPVLRHAERLSFAEIELKIGELAKRAQDNQLVPDELVGGTFTISNGGVYGSLLSTPIVNPPQSGILGMHSIQERPIAENGQVVIRPMMYVALTYDHRIVDGREAVTFLKRVKECIEDPARMLIEV